MDIPSNKSGALKPAGAAPVTAAGSITPTTPVTPVFKRQEPPPQARGGTANATVKRERREEILRSLADTSH